MIISTNAAEELRTAKEIAEVFGLMEEKAAKIKHEIGFYTIKDVCKLTGISEPRVQDIFNRPDFPVCDYGKSKIVFIPAFYDYFMKPVRQGDFRKRR
jgi:hypothetical protein